MSDTSRVSYVNYLPDLMTWDDYEAADRRKVIHIHLKVTDEGLEIIGDSPYPYLLEKLLKELDPQTIEMMLCG